MTNGSEILRKIKKELTSLESESGGLLSKISSYESQIQRSTGQREDAFSEMALIYLPEMKAAEIKKTLQAVRQDVEEIYNQKQRRRELLQSQLEESIQRETKLDSKYEQITESLNTKVRERDDLVKLVDADLSQNEAYKEILVKGKQAEEKLNRNSERLKEVQREAEEKLPAYENNKLFMYLINRGFDTDKYESKGLAKTLDAWVAEKVNFKDNKDKYDYLRSLPELMQIEYERREEDVSNLLKQARAAEKETADRHGLTKANKDGESLGKERQGIMYMIEKENNAQKNYEDEIQTLQNTKGVYHQEALQKLKDYLKGETITDLMEQARSTGTPKDDELVGIIDQADQNIKDSKTEIKVLVYKKGTIDEKLKGLKSIKNKFESNDYDSSYSEFDHPFNIDKLLIAYMAGTLTGNKLWNEIERNQEFNRPEPTYTPTRTSSDDGSSGSGGGWGSGSSGGFGGGFGGGGGWSSGGGFGGGGGGWSSGKGF